MITNNILSIPSFVSHAQVLLPIMHHCLSGDPDKRVVISKSLLFCKPLIVPIEETNAYCITLDHFLVMLDNRIKEEYAYREEIKQLKNNICEEFNKLCSGSSDEKLIKFVRDQIQRVINALFDETKIENKIIAERFFNNMMNGFEEEALNLNEFGETVHTILWKPLLTSLPTQLVSEMKKLIEELKNDRSAIKIEEIALKSIKHIKAHLRAIDIKDSDFNSSEMLRSELEGLTHERRTCNVELKNVHANECVILEYMRKCVEKVQVVMKSKVFFEREIEINYEEIYLKNAIEAKNFEKLFEKIQKKIKLLCIWFGKGSLEDYKKISENLSKLNNILNLNLNFPSNGIGDEEAKLLSSALKNFKNLSTLYLNVMSNNIGEEGAKALSNVLEELKGISALDLNFWFNNIGKEGAKAVSCALSKLKHLSTLTLNFSNNDIGDEGAKAISIALSGLKNISFLYLILWRNNIREEGAIAVLVALKELEKLPTLSLNILSNNIGEKCKADFQKFQSAHSNYRINYQI